MFSLRPRYKSLPDGEDADEAPTRTRTAWQRIACHWKDILLCALSASTLFLSLSALYSPNPRDAPTSSYVYSDSLLQQIRYDWWTRYSSPHPEEVAAVDQAWDAIVPAHGIVAVDRAWAATRGFPDSLSWPSDESKGVYIIDAYHQLHCLKIMRKLYYELARGEPLSYHADHANHCFDSIRQYIMCGTTGETLLYTWGKNITGDGQMRQCHDWGKLRGWAKEHSACYKDTESPVILKEHFGHCHEGNDGLELAI